jgi:hypothetical protein
MNLTEDRQAIADAASAVAGVKCSPLYRQITKPGDAMVRWDGLERDTSGFAFMGQWRVLVATPQDLPASDTWTDENTEALIDALGAVLVVTSVAPVELALDTGKIPALQISGVRAS